MDLVLSEAKQKLLIEYMLSSPDIFAIVNNIISHKYFSPEYRQPIKFIKKYYEHYHQLPDTDIIFAETDVLFELKENITKDKKEYIILEIERLSQLENFRLELLRAADQLLEGKSLEVIKDNFIKSTELKLAKLEGISFFEDPETLLTDIADEPTVSTGWTDVDEKLGGGFRRKETVVISAGTGIGKSLSMANIALSMSVQNLNVLYISLEISKNMIAKRLTAMVTDVNPNVLKDNMAEAIIKLNMHKPKHTGEIFIERLNNGLSANDLRAYLKNYEVVKKSTPDVLLLDYIDLCSANNGETNVSEKDKRIMEEFNQVIFEYNMIGITCSQNIKNHEQQEFKNTSVVAGGAYKINGADVAISILGSPEMKAQGIVQFVYLKTRSSDSVGKITTLRWDSRSLRFENPTEDLVFDPPKKIKNNDDLNKAKTSERSALMDRFKHLK